MTNCKWLVWYLCREKIQFRDDDKMESGAAVSFTKSIIAIAAASPGIAQSNITILNDVYYPLIDPS